MIGDRADSAKGPGNPEGGHRGQGRPDRPSRTVAGLGEIGLVEEVATDPQGLPEGPPGPEGLLHRPAARPSRSSGSTAELAAFDKVPKTQYLGVAELAGPNLKPLRRIDAADQLFKEGISSRITRPSRRARRIT